MVGQRDNVNDGQHGWTTSQQDLEEKDIDLRTILSMTEGGGGIS